MDREILIFPGISETLLFKTRTYRVSLSIEFNSWRMYPLLCIFHTGTDPNLIKANVLNNGSRDNVLQRDMPKVKSPSHKKLVLSGAITFHLRRDELHTRVTIGVVYKLALAILLGMTFINKFIKTVHAFERKIVPNRSPPVTVQIVREVNGAA